jgi:hypothetical protein
LKLTDEYSILLDGTFQPSSAKSIVSENLYWKLPFLETGLSCTCANTVRKYPEMFIIPDTKFKFFPLTRLAALQEMRLECRNAIQCNAIQKTETPVS